MARLFVAAELPPDVIDRLGALPRPDRRGVRWTRPEHWHVTLRFLGDVPDVTSAVQALRGVRAGPADAALGPRPARLGRNVLCVPVAGLEALAGAVSGATAAVGEPPDPRPFAGHVTLARLNRVGACGLADAAVSARWVVRDLVLVRSDLGAGADGRPRYSVLARVPLGWGRRKPTAGRVVAS